MADAPGSPVAAAERRDPFTPSNVGSNTPGMTVLRINKHTSSWYRKIYREQLNEQFQHTVVRDTPPSLTEQETVKGLKEMIDAGISPAELVMDPVDAAQAYRMALMAQNKSKGAGSSSSAVDLDAD